MNAFYQSIISILTLGLSFGVSTEAWSASLTAQEKALHVLNRFAYGPAYGQIERMPPLSDQVIEKWFENQLNKMNSNEVVLNDKLKNLKSLKLSNQEMVKEYPQKNAVIKLGLDEKDVEGGPKDILKELSIQKIVRGVDSENQLEEVMVDFWFNHFNVYFDKGPVRQLLTSYERDVIRPYVFGRFEDMLLAVAKSPAMLIYLDNQNSRKGKINENYARELMELHTLGVDGGYTQKDIQEAARVLTGWGVEKPRKIGEYKFFKGQHDKDPKQVLELNFVRNEGESEGEKLIRYLANHKSTAQFIARKLAIKFIDDEPSQATVDSLADVFLKTKGDLKQVYRAIYKSPEFWSEKAVRSKIKTPFEYMISAARTLNVRSVASDEKINVIKNFLDQSGQSIYRCQPPTGYKAISSYWVSPGAMVNRINFSMALARHKVPQLPVDTQALLMRYNDQKFKNQIDVLNLFNKDIFGGLLKPETLQQIDRQLRDTESYKTKERDDLPLHYFPNEKILALMLSSPEFQRR